MNGTDIGPKKVHYGLLTYANKAKPLFPLDQEYKVQDMYKRIRNIFPEKGGLNIVSALSEAMHHSFTIYGGVRQSVPKSMVLIVPEGVRRVNSDEPDIEEAAEKLKSIGVRLIVVRIGRGIKESLYSRVSSQPSSRYLQKMADYKELESHARDTAKLLCDGK